LQLQHLGHHDRPVPVELEPLVLVDQVDVLMRRLLTIPAALLALAATAPAASAAEAIVQFDAGTGPAEQRALVRAAGGEVTRDLHIINGLGVRVDGAGRRRLAAAPGVHAVTANAAARSTARPVKTVWESHELETAFVQSTKSQRAWEDTFAPATGRGVTVAVIDTGVIGVLPDFRVSSEDRSSRVIASVVTNPDATTVLDRYGHGTHVAGLVAGNARALSTGDPLYNKYIGTAPQSKIVSIKASDDHGNSSLIDVIAGLQFAVDHKDEYDIRVINLSMNSTVALPYRIDPLNAAAEAAWFSGIVVVAAAGNRGTDADAVSYAPANDPYVITVGAIDDQGTKDVADDVLAPWSSRGVTQDGFAKPDLVAPGAHIVGPLAPYSDFASLCPACIVDNRYFRIGGTSMAAPIVAGIAADLLSVHPEWTPDQVKGALTYNSGELNELGEPDANLRETADGAWEVAADKAMNAADDELVANVGLEPNELIDPATGAIDYTRASWKRASWKSFDDDPFAMYTRASWKCVCDEMTGGVLPTRASWKQASWSSFLGETPTSPVPTGKGSKSR
jgi:serine protease AprX